MSSVYNGYISRISSDDNGNFSDFTISLTGEKIKKIKILFDKVVNEYATFLKINNLELKNDSYVLDIYIEETNNVNISILSWNKPKRPVRISSIVINDRVVFDKNNGLTEIIRGSQCIDDNSHPIYGLIANYGSFKVKQINDSVENFISASYFDDKRVIIESKGNRIGTFITSTFEKDENNLINFELKDKVLSLQEGYLKSTTSTTILNLFYDIRYNLSLFYNIQFEQATENYIIEKATLINNDNTKGFIDLSNKTVWDCLDMLCQCLGIRVFSDEFGYLKAVEL